MSFKSLYADQDGEKKNLWHNREDEKISKLVFVNRIKALKLFFAHAWNIEFNVLDN